MKNYNNKHSFSLHSNRKIISDSVSTTSSQFLANVNIRSGMAFLWFAFKQKQNVQYNNNNNNNIIIIKIIIIAINKG